MYKIKNRRSGRYRWWNITADHWVKANWWTCRWALFTRIYTCRWESKSSRVLLGLPYNIVVLYKWGAVIRINLSFKMPVVGCGRHSPFRLFFPPPPPSLLFPPHLLFSTRNVVALESVTPIFNLFVTNSVSISAAFRIWTGFRDRSKSFEPKLCFCIGGTR